MGKTAASTTEMTPISTRQDLPNIQLLICTHVFLFNNKNPRHHLKVLSINARTSLTLLDRSTTKNTVSMRWCYD